MNVNSFKVKDICHSDSFHRNKYYNNGSPYPWFCCQDYHYFLALWHWTPGQIVCDCFRPLKTLTEVLTLLCALAIKTLKKVICKTKFLYYLLKTNLNQFKILLRKKRVQIVTRWRKFRCVCDSKQHVQFGKHFPTWGSLNRTACTVISSTIHNSVLCLHDISLDNVL